MKILDEKVKNLVKDLDAVRLNYSINGDFAPSSNNIELGDNLGITRITNQNDLFKRMDSEKEILLPTLW